MNCSRLAEIVAYTSFDYYPNIVGFTMVLIDEREKGDARFCVAPDLNVYS